MFQTDLFAEPRESRRATELVSRAAPIAPAERQLDLPGILARLSVVSERPRHAFMVLNLIAKAGGASGRAGPYVRHEGEAVLIREWLCDALVPMAHRDPRRIARAAAVRTELEARGILPDDPASAERAVDEEVRSRVRRTGLTHVSRAVSDLVKAGLIARHYEGYRVDHVNRGAQRHAVYTVLPATLRALATASAG